MYENQSQLAITPQSDPLSETHNGVEWTKYSYLINYSDLQVIYVIQTSIYVYTLVMTSKGTDQDKDEDSLRELLNTFVIHPQEKPRAL